MSHNDRVVRLASALKNFSSLVAAVSGEEFSGPNIFQEALDALRRLSLAEGIAVVVIGGMATVHHGYFRTTEDIDITVAPDNFPRLLESASRYGFTLKAAVPGRFAELRFQDLKIEVVGQDAFGPYKEGYTSPPAIKSLGGVKGLQFTSLPGFLFMKLLAGRVQDEADIVGVLKTKKPKRILEAVNFIKKNYPLYYPKLSALLDRVEEEKSRPDNFFTSR